MISRMNQYGTKSFHRPAEGSHPFVARNHPKMKVVGRVFVVEVVDVLNVEDTALESTNPVRDCDELRRLAGCKFVEAPHVPPRCQDDQPRDWIGNVLVSMKVRRFVTTQPFYEG